jgi:RNA polymerase sigma-70 factor, ECF subfamily
VGRVVTVEEALVEATTIENRNKPTVGAMSEDAALVEQSQNGDAGAFEELIRRYDRKLFRIALNITHNAEDSEDAVQAAFFKAYQNLSRFHGDAKFSTWLTRIALNESLTRLRKRNTLQEQSIDSDFHGDDDAGAFPLLDRLPVDLSDWAQSPDLRYSTVELRTILTRALRRLRPSLRIVFVLRDIDEHSIAETSEILKLSATAVKARLLRARLQLREDLTRYFKRREHSHRDPSEPGVGGAALRSVQRRDCAEQAVVFAD